jgi:hypothetical protein
MALQHKVVQLAVTDHSFAAASTLHAHEDTRIISYRDTDVAALAKLLEDGWYVVAVYQPTHAEGPTLVHLNKNVT